jgi:hypothetical protein
MEKYARFRPKTQEKKRMSPIWRGIGCLLIIVFPLLSFLIMRMISPSVIATGLVPHQLLGRIYFPAWVFKLAFSASIASFIHSLENPLLNLILFFVVLLFLSGITSFIYVLIYKVIGPPRYTELDAPPSKHKPMVYRR